MALQGDVFSWGRNIEGQLGDNTTDSTFTSAATAYPVAPSGASDDFDILNIARDEVVRGITVSIPSSAARWQLTGESGNGNDNFIIEDGKLKWDGTGYTSENVTGTMASNWRFHAYRWSAYEWEVQVDFDILQWDQPSASTNQMRLLLWNSNTGYVTVGRRISSAAVDETFLFGTATGTVTWATAPTSGKFKFEYRSGVLKTYMWTNNPTAGYQWEWDEDTAGYTMTEDFVAPTFVFQHIQQSGSGMNVEWDNLQVIGQPPDGGAGGTDTPGFAYWEQPSDEIEVPYLEFSGDTPGTTANNIQRAYRTYDGSPGVIYPLREGVSLPLFTVAGSNLYFDGITNNPNGARDLHAMVVFEEDFEIIWQTNIVSAPNTCCWSTRLSCYQYDDSTSAIMSFEPEYGYSGARRYRVWKDPGTGGAWANGATRTDAIIRMKIVHIGNNWEVYAWYNGIWNQISTTMTQTATHNPTVLTWRFSNWSVWPGFQADLESLTIVPSGTPDGSFYYADAPYVPSPSGYTEETAILVGDPNFEDMAGGVNHAIGLKQDGSAWAWGDNQFGQLGDGTLVNKSSPVSVLGDRSYVEITPASDHNLALDVDGNIFAWGRNDFGQLGSFALSGSDQNSPISVTGTFITASTGLDHSLAIDRDNQVWSWGRNDFGQLGTGDVINRATPTLVSGLPNENFIKVTGGAEHSCAMTELGDVWCWGNNEFGQASISPLDIGAIGAGGQGYGGALDSTTGNLWMWGQGVNGVLGINSITNRSSPVTVAGPQGWGLYEGEITSIIQAAKQIPGGARGIGMFSDNVSWATKTDGSLWMWGDATQGNLGTGQFETNYSSPRSVLGGHKFFFVGSTPGSPASTYALDIDGDIWVWGATQYILGGVGGAAASYNSPVQVDPFIFAVNPHARFINNKFHVLSAGVFGGMALNGTTAWVWGSNSGGYDGRLCTGDLVNYFSPVSITGAWTHLAHGSGNSLLLDTFGNVWGCGATGGGLAGWGPAGTYVSNPTSILGGPHSAIKVAAGNASQTFGFLREDGSLWMWGYNFFGQLGVGDTVNRTSPTSVLGSGDLYNFVDFVVGGQNGTVAIDDTGQVWGWGHWSSVGDNTITNRSSPTKTSLAVITPETFKTPSLVTSGAIDLDAGGYHNIILDSVDKAWSWGRNDLGQLGDNSLTDKFAPVSAYTTNRFVDISAGENHSWAMKADGTICTWGAGDWGKLFFNEDENPRSTPICGNIFSTLPCLPFLPNTGNQQHSTLVDCRGLGSVIGSAWCWGCNDDGKLGDGTISNRSTPTLVIGNKRWLDMSGGGDFTIALDDGGRIWAWGDDSKGQLGDG